MTDDAPRWNTRLAAAAALSAGGCALVALTAAVSDTRLGAPVAWTWVLTGVQVLALWAAGRGKWWAWLLGAGVQPVWIVYALCTAQLGFVPGCLVSAAVQVRNYLDQPEPLAAPATVTQAAGVS